MKITDRQHCFGCGACSDMCPSQNITMERDEDGFSYPIINPAACTDCGLCIAVCPSSKGIPAETNAHSLSAYAAKHSMAVRSNSASGGAFTAISDQIIRDGGVIYGAAFDKALRLHHEGALTQEQRNWQRDSKYVQSDTSGIFRNVEKHLLSGVKVLFSGCPCQVDALKRYIEQKPGLQTAAKDLYLVDILCSGVPSPQLFEDYIAFVQHRKGKRVTGFTFRNKEKPWGIHNEKITFADGTTDSQSALSQGYKNIFGLNIAFRPACYECPYAGPQRTGDITIGDFWGIEKAMPGFRDSQGVSAVLVNTEQGINLIDRAKGELELLKCTAEDVFRLNHKRPASEKKEASQAFYRIYREQGIGVILAHYGQYNGLGKMKSLFFRMVGEGFKPKLLTSLYQVFKGKNTA